ncbi:MAG: carboxypeptidase regulatory-like domain-containing protein [Planctomycetes bacterium]|nr:carboxypeptidase regulatory-like domain-containing protein [Planctomycetota bacterium]
MTGGRHGFAARGPALAGILAVLALAALAAWLARSGHGPWGGERAGDEQAASGPPAPGRPHVDPRAAPAAPPAAGDSGEERAAVDCPAYFGVLLSLGDGAAIEGGAIELAENDGPAGIRSGAGGRFSWRAPSFTGEALRARISADGFVPAWHEIAPLVENRVALAPAARMHFLVIDARTQGPVAGARVRTVLDLGVEAEEVGVTDAAGTLETAVPWAFERLEVDAEGYEMGYGPGFCTPTDEEVRVELEPVAALELAVSDESGAPVEAPRFTIDPPGHEIAGAQALVRSGDRPIYRVPCRAWCRVIVAADGYASQVVEAGAVASRPFEVRLAPGFALLLAVASDNGSPLAAEAAISEEQVQKEPPLAAFRCLARTDSTGFARIGGLARGGEYVLVVRAAGHLEQEVRCQASAERDQEALRIDLVRADHSLLAGRVIDEDCGAGIPGARISVAGASGVFAVTGEGGAFECRVPEHGGDLRVSAPGYCAAAVSVVEVESRGGVIGLSRGGTIRGCVVDQTGKPVPCAHVFCLEAEGSSPERRVTADQVGEFEISGLVGTSYCLGAAMPWNVQRVADTNAAPGDTVRLVVWRGADLRVRVLCGEGAMPRWKLYVAEFTPGGEIWRAHQPPSGCDEQRVTAPAGECWIKVGAEGYSTVVRRLFLAAGERARVEVALARGSRVEVRLRDARDGAPLAGAAVRVNVCVEEGARPVNVGYAETDAGGLAAFLLADGLYQAAGTAGDGREASRTFRVNGGARVEIDL